MAPGGTWSALRRTSADAGRFTGRYGEPSALLAVDEPGYDPIAEPSALEGAYRLERRRSSSMAVRSGQTVEDLDVSGDLLIMAP
jgi:hypothetical protein